jgi:hypothetical protein
MVMTTTMTTMTMMVVMTTKAHGVSRHRFMSMRDATVVVALEEDVNEGVGFALEDRPSQTTTFFSPPPQPIQHNNNKYLSDSSSPHPTNDHGGRRHDRIIVYCVRTSP